MVNFGDIHIKLTPTIQTSTSSTSSISSIKSIDLETGMTSPTTTEAELDQVSSYHPDLIPIFKDWFAGLRNIGQIGAKELEGLRNYNGLDDNVTPKLNYLILKKHMLKNNLIKSINQGQGVDWTELNKKYCRLLKEIAQLEAKFD